MNLNINNNNLELLFLVKSGSRLYGTQFEKGEHNLMKDYESDFDYKGVFAYSFEENFKIRRNDLAKIIPVKEKSKNSTLNNKIKLNSIINKKFPQLNLSIENDDVDLYELRHFIELASTNNPNIMDLLFVPLEDYAYISDKGMELLKYREEFISKEIIKKFIGYSNEQLNKIKSHKKWLNKYPKINKVYLKLKELYQQETIDCNWITDIFGGKLSTKISNLTQEERNKLPKQKGITWDVFLNKYSDEKITQDDWNYYRKPELINYCSFKDVTTHKFSKDSLVYSSTPNKADFIGNRNHQGNYSFEIFEKKDIEKLETELHNLKETFPSDSNSIPFEQAVRFSYLNKILFNSQNIVDFVKYNSSFRQVNKSQFNIFTKPYKEAKSNIFLRNGFINNNSSEDIGIYAFSMGFDLEKYKQIEKEINDLWEWKCGRNEKRGILEETYGYDVKNGAHLYRLMLQAKQIIKTHTYNPVLTKVNRDKVKSVLLGKLTYNELIEISEGLKKELSNINNNLPFKISDKKINNLLLSYYEVKKNSEILKI